MSLRTLMEENDILFSMSCFDAISAQIIERAGFEFCAISGLSAQASDLGAPDLGLGSLAEVVKHASSIVDAVDIPVICDADTGFGGATNVVRTTRMFERAGVAAIHLEDQASPKRCGALAGKSVIGMEQAARKIRAAADARRSKDFLIIARTDAGGLGLDEVIRRLNTYVDNGADIAMVGEFFSMEAYQKITKGVKAPLLTATSDQKNLPNQPFFTKDEWKRTGVKFVMHWHELLFGPSASPTTCAR